jgi:hypothetical protein
VGLHRSKADFSAAELEEVRQRLLQRLATAAGLDDWLALETLTQLLRPERRKEG